MINSSVTYFIVITVTFLWFLCVHVVSRTMGSCY